jgi:hypothetical protein
MNFFSKKKVLKPIDAAWLERAKAIVSNTPDQPIIDRCAFHHLFVYDDMQRGRQNHSMLVGDLPDCQLVATGFTEAQFHLWRRLPDQPRKLVETASLPGEGKADEKGFFTLPSKTFKIEEEEKLFYVNTTLIVPLHKRDQNDTTEWSDLARQKNRHDHWAKIKGELWKVPSSRFNFLDQWMHNGRLFKRERVTVEIPLKIQKVYDDGTSEIERIVSDQEAFMYVGIPEVWEPQLDGGYLFQAVGICERASLSRKYYAFGAKEEDLE